MKKSATLLCVMAIIFMVFFIKNIYAVNFGNENQIKKANIYLATFSELTQKTADYYATAFGLPEEHYNDNDFFKYSDNSRTLKIYKQNNFITYTTTEIFNNEDKQKIDEEQAVDIAISFFENKLLKLVYKEILIGFDGHKYTVTFISNLGELSLYAFNNSVEMDLYGNILNMEYYFLTFSKYGSCIIRDLKDAEEEARQIIKDSGQGISFEEGRVKLVYAYENSVIQPMYLFEGLNMTGDYYQLLVNGALYN